MTWRIYYSDFTMVEGESQAQWLAAPDNNVEVVVEIKDPDYNSHRTYKDANGINHVVYGKQLWDGLDEYDPFGWGVKLGKLMPDTDYFTIWNTACGDN